MVDYSLNDFNIETLGSFYQKNKTIFRVFAPESKQLFLVIDDYKYEMHKRDFYFEIVLSGDLEKVKYYYLNDLGVSYRDPFAYCSDDKYSYVLDTSKFLTDKVLPKEYKNIIIYETSVRDFSCANCYPSKTKRKLLSLVESGLKIDNHSVGLDYLKELGITHLQLMPIFDFDLDKTDYNWGYNPLAYNYLNKDYILDNQNPYAYINELRYVTNKLHENNIRLTLDVVFNHVYQYFKYDLDSMIPGHVFRVKEDGTRAEGTFCGNEIKSEDVFVREYIVEMCKRYIKLFDIDGIRIDLMGILDYETVNKINLECKKLKNDFIVYGEGWNMGDVLAEDKRATILNYDKLPGVAMFNDYYRETIIKYASGDDSIIEDVKKVLSGNSDYLDYHQSLNYVECHDQYTFFDRMLAFKNDDSIDNKIRRCKLALGLVMISKGIPFIHSGQEFLRTKKGVNNSYNSDETINLLDWKLRIDNNDIVNYFKDLVDVRNNYDEFTSENIDISFQDYYECLIYRLNNIMVIINPCMWDHTYNDGNNYNIVFDLNGKTNNNSDSLNIPAYSMLICKR